MFSQGVPYNLYNIGNSVTTRYTTYFIFCVCNKRIKIAFRIHFLIWSPTILVLSILVNLFVSFTVQILLRLFITSNIFIHLTVLSLHRVKVETKHFFTYDNSLSVGVPG